jgi:WD40 repeat protein
LEQLNTQFSTEMSKSSSLPVIPSIMATIQVIDLMSKINNRKEQLKEELIASQTYITSSIGNVHDMDADDSFAVNGNVLVTKQSKLVSILLVEAKNQLLSIDCDFLMRVWSLSNKNQVTALLLRAGQSKKMTCAAIDSKEKHLAISDEEGLITIHNIHSGGILHSLTKIGVEITQIEFLVNNTNFWLCAVGWDGRMVFIKTPMYQKNTYTVPMVLKKTPHNGDIYTMDHLDALSATGGVDNKVCIWNSISGTVRSIMSMPRRDNRPNIFVSQVKFMKSSLLGDGGYPVVLLLVI